jgi:hypothetical protein
MINKFEKMTDPTRKFRSLKALSYPIIGLFGVLLIMALFLVILGFSYALFHRDLYSQETGSMAFIFALMALFVNFELYFWVAAGVVFLIWVYRAHNNLSSLKVRGLEFTPGWAVGLWFIPLVNLFKPFAVMREIWHGSDPENDDNNKNTRALKGTPEILGFWWGLLLAAGFTGRIANAMAGTGTIEENRLYPAALVLSELIRFGALVLIILIVKEITRRQDARYQKLADLKGVVPPPPSFTPEDLAPGSSVGIEK